MTDKTTLDEMMANPLMPRPIATAPVNVDILVGWVHMAAISIGQVDGRGNVYLRDRTDTRLSRYDDDGDPPTTWWPMPSTFADIENLEQDRFA